ncbi:MAG: type II toxin-antitoxin system RelE/ParE family toxin [Desulfuromonadales bacterium]|nr:type II toxin-antitoxin system RelE/ParE family toxin [Desulfuromonadales bacterium]
MVTVAETGEFVRRASSLLADDEREALVFYLSYHPEAGVLVRETGGLRKLRWGIGSKGKRGGARVIYYFHSERMPLYLLTVYAKGEQADLSSDDRRQLRSLVDLLRKANGL